MDFWRDTNWFAVHTKPHQETLAAAHVAKLDIEVFLPRIRAAQSPCRSLRLFPKALFPGYCFARFCPLLSYDAVRYSPGVLRVVGDGRLPIPLAPAIITEIQDRIRPDGFVCLDSTGFRPGDRVSIEQGLLAGWMGRVEHEWDGGRRVMVLLNAINQARLLVEKRWLVLETV